MAQDRIYSVPLSTVGDFEFDDAVADVFPDMIRRSVPGYSSMLSMIARCGHQFAKPGTNIYDLGCSLGAGTVLLAENSPPDTQIHAIDNSQAMIQRLQVAIDGIPQCQNVVPVVGDIRQVDVQTASLTVMNLTLQFLPVEERDSMIRRIADGTIEGGALLLSEKICFHDTSQQQLMTELHLDFKRAHGYSELEIAQKRTSIENRLVPETLEAHIQRLRAAGFRTVSPWFQCFTFASVLAVK